MADLFDLFREEKRPYIMAHRGNRNRYPENTIAAFRQAFVDEANILETDLHISLDGHFVCIHDETVDRTTNGIGAVASMSLAALKDLKILDAEGRESGDSIPTLAETAEFLPDRKAIALELKSDRFLEKSICEKLGQELLDHNIHQRTIFLSFSLAKLQCIKQVLPESLVGWITLTRLIPDKPVELIGALWPVFYLNPWYVRWAHKRGMYVCPLDPDPIPRLKKYIRMDCDAVLADDPAAVRIQLKALRERL